MKPYIAYFNICVLWGSSNVVSKIGLGSLNTSVFTSLRYLITGFILLVIALVFKLKFPKKLSEWKILTNISLLMIFITVGCIALANKYADSGMVTIIQSTVPIMIVIIECFILKTYTLSYKGIIGLIGGFFGIIIIVLFGTESISADIKGIFFAFLGSLAFTVGSLYSKNRFIEGSAIAQTAAQGLIASALFFIAGKVTGDFVISNITFKSMFPVFYLAIIDSLIGFISYIYLMKIWKSSKVSTYAYINPVVALILGALILSETITVGKVAGMIIIIGSVILIQKDKTTTVEKIEN